MKLWIFIAVTITFILAGAQIMLSNNLLSSGALLIEKQKETQKIKEDLDLLQKEIASASALNLIKERARENGFVVKVTPLQLAVPQ